MKSDKLNPIIFNFYKSGMTIAFQIEPVCEEVEKDCPDVMGEKIKVKECAPHSDTPEKLVTLFNDLAPILASHGFNVKVFGRPQAMLSSMLKRMPEFQQEKLVQLEYERMEWSFKTFPEATAMSSLLKLEEEIREVRVDIVTKCEPQAKEEYADMLMCMFDSAGRFGIFPEEIIDAFEKKIAKNKARNWIKNEDNTYSHKKD